MDDSDEDLVYPTASEAEVTPPPSTSPLSSKSPSPIPLPSVSVFIDYIINGKPANRSRQSVEQLEVGWYSFRTKIHHLCESKLPSGQRISEPTVHIDLAWAWCTQSKAYSKTTQIPYSDLGTSFDFVALQQAVRGCKKPGEMILKLLATIKIESEEGDIPESSQRPTLREVQVHLYYIDIQDPTGREKEVLASMRDDAYIAKYAQLSDLLKCDVHYNQKCYKFTSSNNCRPSDHIKLDAKAIADWTTSILNGGATLTNPPRTEEFERILNPRSRSKSSSSNLISTPNTNAPPIIVNFGRHGHGNLGSPWSSSPPCTPHTPRPVRRSSRAPAVFSSPLVDHESFEQFNGDGLRAFIVWCEQEYKVRENNTEFKEAYQIMRAKGIGVDILEGKDSNWLTAQGILVGTADRIARSFRKWLSKLLPHKA
jgi:hypothetical protein